MTDQLNSAERSDPSLRPLMRSLSIELAIYAPLVTVYFILVMHFAKKPLVDLYHEAPVLYAILATLVIIAQGVLLEIVTSWLLRKIGFR
jgi:hypothetical protein